MNAQALCDSGNCDPYTCPVCANTCDWCGEFYDHCTCPTLPLDEEDET